MNSFDWPRLLNFGLFQLGLQPQAFWALTPAEFQLLAGGGRLADQSMTRDGLEALLRQFPDRHESDN